jgi:hypothetical protein
MERGEERSKGCKDARQGDDHALLKGIEPSLDVVEPGVNPVEATIDLLETLIDLLGEVVETVVVPVVFGLLHLE